MSAEFAAREVVSSVHRVCGTQGHLVSAEFALCEVVSSVRRVCGM